MFDFDDEEKGNPIGSLLHYHREQKKFNLDDISEKLRVRREYLEAMERGRFDLLPAGIYQRSFLKAYAEFLKLDADHLLKILEEQQRKTQEGEGESLYMPTAQFEKTSEEARIVRGQLPPQKAPSPTKPPSRESRAGFWFLVFLGFIIGVLCLIFLFKVGIRSEQESSASQAVAGAESVLVTPEPVDTMELFMNLLDEKIEASPELILRIEAAGRSWMRVVSDGAELFTGFVNENMNAEFLAKDELSINLGVNQGVKAWLNGFEMIPLENGIIRLNRENFKEFIPTDRANQIVREHE